MDERRKGEHRPISRDSLITLGDLEIFKAELIERIRDLIKPDLQKPTKKWLKSTEVKKLLGISTGTLQNLRMNGSLSFSKIGGIIFYNYEEIMKLLEANEKR
jgi:hypothetical protein